MDIYIDVVFAINLVMDYFILWIVSKLVRKKVPYINLLIGSSIMSFLYCLLLFTPFYNKTVSYFLSFIVLLIGTIITFRPKTPKTLFKLIIFAHISGFAVGGMGMAIFFYTSIGSYMGNMMVYTVENFSFKILIISISISYIIMKLLGKYIRNLLIKKQSVYTINIYFQEEVSVLEALVDTGNTLHEPLSQAPVIVTELKAIENALPSSIKELFTENDLINFDLSSLFINIDRYNEKHEHYFYNSIRIIPFKSVGKENGMLIGFKPDKVEIIYNNSIINLKNVVIGVYNCCLSKDGTYQGLLSPDMITNM